jgi:LmbE family N-acetylglucosaminyl deacetylase
VKILVIGAHPDDCDLHAGGSAALWKRRGDAVRFVSITDGGAGHYRMDPPALVERRRTEAREAAAVIGIDYEIIGIPDGQLAPSLENRQEVIRMMRRYGPDLVVTHRSNDYHPDHRYTSTLVQDSAYMVTAPLVCPEVPHLQHNPVIAYFYDDFTKPTRSQIDIAVDVDPVMDQKWEMLHAHASQFYEWLPFNKGILAEVPEDDAAKKAWLKKTWGHSLRRPVEPSQVMLAEIYGKDHAASVEFAEAFEICEFGRQPSVAELRKLFPVTART